MSRLNGSLDANILLRWLLSDIPDQQRAVDLLLQQGKYHVSDLAIIEVAFILEKHLHFSRNLISENILQIIDHPAIQANKNLFALALPPYLVNAKLSLVDCCLAGYANLQNALPLWTFDKKLANQCPSARSLPRN